MLYIYKYMKGLHWNANLSYMSNGILKVLLFLKILNCFIYQV